MSSAQGRSERDRPSIAALPTAELAVLVALCAWAAVVNFWIFRHFVWDDAYITYRYAQNLAEGHGFVFNHGDRLLGTSTPLYALLLGLLGAVGVPIELASGVLFSLFLSAAALQGALLLRRQGSPILALGFVILVVGGFGSVLHFFGMETTLMLWLLAAAVTAADRRRPVVLGVVLGLAVLCRYDAALATLAIGALALAPRRDSEPVRARLRAAGVAAIAFVATVLPWFVFAQLYFGSVLPATLSAKAGDVSFGRYIVESLPIQLDGLHPLRRVPLRPPFADVVRWGWFAVLLVPLPWAVTRVLRLPARLLLFLYPPILWLAYGWIGPPVVHHWHLIPSMFLLTLLGGLAWGALWRRPAAPAVRTLALIGAAVFAAFLPAAAETEERGLVDNGFHRGRARAYREIAGWITRNRLSELTLATYEPGYLCYLSRSPAIDLAGLVTRGIYFHGPEQRRSSEGELLERLEPAFIVTSFRHPPGMSAPGYVSVWDSFPGRQLLMRKEAFAQVFDRLLLDWRSTTPPASAVGHPFRFDFRPDGDGGFVELGGFAAGPGPAAAGGPDGVALVTDPSSIPWMGGETPPLRLDFDEIAFRFHSTSSDLAVAQLVVDGQTVLQSSTDQRIRRPRDGGVPTLGPVPMVWPVRPWRGRTAVLRFVDLAPETHFLAADDIRSLRDAGPAIVVDDFEADSFGPAWEHVFAAGPYPLRDLARDLGFAFAVGDRAAVSLGRSGRQLLRSRPLDLDRGQLSMLAFDLGKGATIEVVVGGKRRRLWRGSGSGRLVPITWDLSRWRGASAVLEVRDNDPAPERGIGVDEIVMFDRAE